MMWSFFSSAPTSKFNYELGEEVRGVYGPSIWHLHTGKNKTSGDVVSIFVFDLKSETDVTRIDLAKKCVKRFKTLRHPNIVMYIDEIETDKVIYLVTENVMPLNLYLQDEDSKKSADFIISWGICQIANGISFLNDAGLIHNNMCISSVFVDRSGEWKIGGLEFMFSSSETPIRSPPPLQMYEPPEVSKGGLAAQKQPTARDLWGVGCLLWEVFNGMLSKSTQLKVPGTIPGSLIPIYCELVSSNPRSRPVPSKLLETCKQPGSYLHNEFVRTMVFLNEIDIKDKNEKVEFFEQLTKIVDNFPEAMCKYKILPKLLKAYEFGGADSKILSPILKLGKYLEDSEYQEKIVPFVVKLFSSPDRATRVNLLQQLDVFAAHLKPKTVNDLIFPTVVQGFMDTNPFVRESSIKAMIHLAPKLSYKLLNEEVMKHFARLQSKDPEAGIRTNTTICLSKIACYINPQVRRKILISAFTRGAKDPSEPARLAAIQAMSATQKFYTMNDLATHLMPVLAALTVDKGPSVREAVFKIIKSFLLNLEKASDNPDLINELEKDVMSSDTGSYDDSWAGWAMSFTSKLYKQRSTSPAQASVTKTDHPETSNIKSKTIPAELPKTVATEYPIDVAGRAADGWEGACGDDQGEEFKDEFIDDSNTTGQDGWNDLDDWGVMDDSELVQKEDFSPADPSLPTSAEYSGWDNSSDDFLPTNSDGEDFFSSTLKETKPAAAAKSKNTNRTRLERKSAPRKDTVQSEYIAQATDDDWSTNTWGSFPESTKDKRLPKPKPVKLGAKKM